MTLSSQKPQRPALDDHDAKRARHHGLRAVARALGLRDFVELRRPRRRKAARPITASLSQDSATFRSAETATRRQ